MKIPKEWKDITIEQFQELRTIQNAEHEFFLDKEISILSVLTQMDSKELEAIPKADLIRLSTVTNFINKPLSERLHNHFRIGRRLFKVRLKAEQISAEQFILLNRYTESNDDTIENLHYIMAVLTNEVGWFGLKKFDVDFEGKAKLFKENLSIEHAFAPSVFFFEVYKSWLKVSETYLLKEAKKMKVRAEMELAKMKQPQ